MADASQLEFRTPDCVAAPLGNYSHVVSVPAGHRLLVLAGQAGNALDGTVAEHFVGQLASALENILAILASEGAGPEAIVKLNTWAVAGVDISGFQEVREQLFKGARPATTFAYVSALYRPDLLVEVECWAAVPA